MDMFVSVEYCNKCYEHEELTRHDEHCYQEVDDMINNYCLIFHGSCVTCSNYFSNSWNAMFCR